MVFDYDFDMQSPDVDKSFFAYKNKPCVWGFGFYAKVDRFELVERPKHGIVGLRRLTSGSPVSITGAYKPNDGYVGNDNFIVQLTWSYKSNVAGKIEIPSYTTRLHYRATVN